MAIKREKKKVTQPIFGPTLLMRNVSVSSFSVAFSESKNLLELVWGLTDSVMSSIYMKMGEKAVISEERVVRTL